MRRALSLAVGAGAMLFAGNAFADFHFMKIAEVFAGAPAAPNAHYVQLQMFEAGQTNLINHDLVVYDAAGTVTATIPLAVVTKGADDSTVLIGTASVTTAFGVTPDFTLPALSPAGGKVCFDPNAAVDCFAWGNYTGDATGTTAPFAALTAGKAAKLKISGGSSTTALDDGDDTGNSSVDYVAAAPAPKNNAGTTGALDGGAPDDGGSLPPVDAATPPTDSGITTVPTPPREGGTSGNDASTGGGGGSSSDDSGCSLGMHSADPSVAGLALVGIASMIALSRRRRSRG